MSSSLPLRVFIASPGDASAERDSIRRCVERFNDESSAKLGVRYEPVGYESVRGTARRPQAAINELIHESHFLVAVFRGSWGSEPGSPWGYTSGTEEELFTALFDLASDARPMRDVWLAFMASSDVEPQVEALRQQIVDRHALYFEACSGEDELVGRLADRLRDWVSYDHKETRRVSLVPSSGIDLLGAARMRGDGEKLVELGYPEQGLSKLKEAARVGGPDEKLAYARYLGRSGRFTEAHAAVAEAIGHFVHGAGDARSAAAAEAYAADATLWRREHELVRAASILQHALELLQGADLESRVVRARMYDDLGLAQQAQVKLEQARDSFQAAHEIRMEIDDPVLIAQSEVNLARISSALGQEAVAQELAETAMSRLEGTPPTSLHANACVLLAEQRLRAGMVGDAEESAREAVALNGQFGNDFGSAVSNFVLAQVLHLKGDRTGAVASAQESVRINEVMRNTQGLERAKRLLDQVLEGGDPS